jgi:glycosyltransferase involved in cell wall biosynthesis
MSLIACIIAYNEERLLPDCLASLKGRVDRIVVVDGRIKHFPGAGHASTDATVQIASEYGAEVIEGVGLWDTEAEKRSAYFVGNEGDWYFMLDADERLMTPLPDELPGSAYSVRVWWSDGGGCQWRPRLFRHTGKMEYRQLHDGLFSDGVLVSNPRTVPKIQSVWLLHVQNKRTAARRAQKKAYYHNAYAHEPTLRKAWRMIDVKEKAAH